MSSDGLLLSKSSKIELNHYVLFLKNLKNKRLMDKLPIYKTFTIFQNSNKQDRDLIVQPLVDELKELESGFETAWSKNTYVKHKLFVADAVCKACLLNIKQNHKGTFPCPKCLVKFIMRFFINDQNEIEKTKVVYSNSLWFI